MIINLTFSPLSPELVAEGVVDIPSLSNSLKPLFTFSSIPSRKELISRSIEVVSILNQHFSTQTEEIPVLISAPQFFTPFLQDTLIRHNYRPLYAFTTRKQVIVETQYGLQKQFATKFIGFIDVL